MQEDKEVATKKQAVLQQLINLNDQEHQRAGAGLREANKARKGRYPE
jgi:predicted Zn-dependent peptidase